SRARSIISSLMGGVFRRRRKPQTSTPARDPRPIRQEDDFAWLLPPLDIHDVSAWDRYWHEQVSHGLGPPLFDMFLIGEEHELVAAMAERGLTTVLCVGNGK